VHAAVGNRPAAVRALVERGADVNRESKGMMTPLAEAALAVGRCRLTVSTPMGNRLDLSA